jgi:two-component system, cell cycle sensor histidine kinase and response regulator CckA
VPLPVLGLLFLHATIRLMRIHGSRGPGLKLALGYAMAGSLWLLGTDLGLDRIGWLPVWGQTFEDWLFVGVSAVLVGVVVDRAWRRQVKLERELRETHKMDALGRLAGGLAHDFNNLLLVIKSVAACLERRLPRGDPGFEEIRHLVGASDRASGLVRQLLDFSRPSGEGDDRCDVGAVVGDLGKLLGPLLGATTRLRVEVDELSCWSAISRNEVERILLNLAVNARDAMPDGGELLVRCRRRELSDDLSQERLTLAAGSYVVLTVSDTGCGMDRRTRRRVFEPYFTTRADGTGLGLSTVYAIARQRAGAVGVYSEPGAGTTFRVYLPELAGGIGAPERHEPGPAPRRAVFAARPTVLLAEDEPGVRRLAQVVLEEAGCRVLEAADGAAALRVAASVSRLDLVVTDIGMPGLGGRQLAERLASRWPGVAVVFITGHAAMIDEPNEEVLEKPFTPCELVEKVGSVLERVA